MSTVGINIKKLAAGEHYGAVFHKTRTETAVFSESVYQSSMAIRPSIRMSLAFLR